jgi:hypothetical protein
MSSFQFNDAFDKEDMHIRSPLITQNDNTIYVNTEPNFVGLNRNNLNLTSNIT